MPKIGWWILICGGAIIVMAVTGFGYLVFLDSKRGSANVAAQGKTNAGSDRLLSPKSKTDEQVNKVVRELMFDSAGNKRDLKTHINVEFFKKLHELAMSGHAGAVYDLALSFSYPNGADLTDEQRNYQEVSQNLMEFASMGGDPRGSLKVAAQHLYGAKLYAQYGSPEATTTSLNSAQRYIQLAMTQGGDREEGARLLAAVDDLRHRDARAFSALAALLVAGIAAGDSSSEGNREDYAAQVAEESARLREQEKRFHCDLQGKSTEYAFYGDWAGC